MPLSLTDTKTFLEIAEAGATVLGIGVAGWWTYWLYIRQGQRHAQIQTSANIEFIGETDEFWLVEIQAILENKGKVEHRFSDLAFDLNAVLQGDALEASQEWNGQIDFPNSIARGSFLPQTRSFFFIGPGVTAKYSYLTKVPKRAIFVNLHCWFAYARRGALSHSMEITKKTPRNDAERL